eukprot:TRINITY_DN6878_c0_g1_i1.p1 TRINITY_DN6878_c0_g1~~TRINITY_DN6878_c0_g1_i1.p1  ORF type:complete len:103 (-),score=19.84 TRINITY_DN6878_c0_g1_i1:340-648(-)
MHVNLLFFIASVASRCNTNPVPSPGYSATWISTLSEPKPQFMLRSSLTAFMRCRSADTDGSMSGSFKCNQRNLCSEHCPESPPERYRLRNSDPPPLLKEELI